MILTIILDAIDANAKNSSTTVSSFGIFDTLIQYGALGLVAIAMGAALWFLLKRMIKTEDKLIEKVDLLQKDMRLRKENCPSPLIEMVKTDADFRVGYHKVGRS